MTIKYLHQKHGFIQQALSENLGVDRQYVWRMENGKINISADYIDNVIKALEVKHTDFLNQKGFNKYNSSNN